MSHKPFLNKKSQTIAQFLDYRTGLWQDTIPDYLLQMIAARRAGKTSPLRVISLGWGVQSTRLLFGAVLGEIDADFAVHSDTTYETESTYIYAREHINYCLERGFPVITTKDPVATMDPINSKNSLHIPAYNISAKGKNKGKVGKLRRQCTGRWKIEPTRRAITAVLEYLGLKKHAGVVQQLLGISSDEWKRAKDGDALWCDNVFPLIRLDPSEVKLPKSESRHDCHDWLIAHGFKVPTKSACFHCVYHNKAVWVAMKIENGSDWKNAVIFDRTIRDKSTKYGGLFIHRSATPLETAIKTPAELGYFQSQAFQDDDDDTLCKDAGYCEFIPA